LIRAAGFVGDAGIETIEQIDRRLLERYLADLSRHRWRRSVAARSMAAPTRSSPPMPSC
jgi:hypothetical protein